MRTDLNNTEICNLQHRARDDRVLKIWEACPAGWFKDNPEGLITQKKKENNSIIQRTQDFVDTSDLSNRKKKKSMICEVGLLCVEK